VSGREEHAVPWPPPRANPELLGQDDAERTLVHAFATGRPAQAWLLTGPKGIGKATLAFRLARHLFAHPAAAAGMAPMPRALFAAVEEGSGGRPAGSMFIDTAHPVFRRVASGGHGDLVTIEPAFDPKRGVRRTEITVDDVRGLGAFLGTTAAEGGWRVAIIDPAEAMNRNAANALLKTLEEPPQGAVILLVSHAPGLLPATVRSRCRRMTLRPLPEPAVGALLARYRPDLAADQAREVARLARGSIGYALVLAGSDFARIERAMRDAFATLPRPAPDAVRGLCDAAAEGGGDGFATVADLLRGWLAAIVRVCAGAAPDTIAEAERTTVATLAGAAPLERWLDVWDKATDALARAEPANMDRRQIILAVFLHIETVLGR
jgi:DNA polymerase-3 subunit delta'